MIAPTTVGNSKPAFGIIRQLWLSVIRNFSWEYFQEIGSKILE